MARNRYDVDEVLEDRFDIRQLKRLAGYVAPYKKKMAGIIVLMLSASALTMMIPIFFQRIMDYYIPQKDMRKIIIASLLTLAVACYSAVAMALKIKTMSIVGTSYMPSAPIFSITCRSCLFLTMTTGLTEKFRCVWLIMSTA